MFHKFMQRLLTILDPKLDKFRAKRPAKALSAKSPSAASPAKPYTPETLPDFIALLKRTPKTVFSDTDRNRLAAVMSFDTRTVRDLMVDKSQMIFVNKKEILGPLILDKLYKSGFTSFPVIDNAKKVVGVIYTDALNTLEVKQTDRAEKYLDTNYHHLRTTDSLDHAASEIKRTGASYFLVLDESGALAGFFTVEILLDYLLGK